MGIHMIRIAIVGAGGMGNVHYQNYQYIEDCEVVAIVGQGDNDQNRAKEWGLPLYADIDTLMQQEAVDVCDICTPTFLHYEQVMKALSYHKDVICEKPLTLHKTLATEIYDFAAKQGCHIYVGHVVQFMKQTQVLRDVVREEPFGKVLDAYFERLSAVPKWAVGSWLFDKEKSGLLPFDLHIHDLDLIVSLFGVSDEVSFTSCSSNDSYPEQYRFFYRYKDKNVIGEAAWFNATIPFSARWRVYFERGYLVNDGASVIAYPEEGDPIYYDVSEEVKVSTGINVPPTGMYLEELKHFIACIQRGEASSMVSPQQVIDVIGVLEDISKQS